jgi:ribonucleoside-diphosphate reductase alpha subunit
MSEKYEDCVIKRNGSKEPVSFDKILKRIKSISQEKTKLHVNYTSLCQKIIDQLYDDITTQEIDELTAQQCASMTTTHPDYGTLASRILISNHHKMVDGNYLNVVEKLYNNTDIHNIKTPIISEKLYALVKNNHELIQSWFDFDRDYLLDYFGFKTLERAYLLKINNKLVERPQHMWMRVALSIHQDDFEKAKETYDMMSNKYFTHATPTLFNAGTPRPQLSSCYLIAMESDSIKGIYNTLGDCAAISKWAGGIGMHIHNIRGAGSHIRGTNGTSNGIVPMLRVFNNTARYVDQCVLPETTIYTTEGPRDIQFCEPNKTSIFTTNGPEPIENVLEHPYEGMLLHINTFCSFAPLSITPKHPIYCLKNVYNKTDPISQPTKINYYAIKNKLDRNLIQPEWVDAKDITKDDLLIFTRPQYELDNFKLTEDDCYMYGLLLGHGYMENNSNVCTLSMKSTAPLEFIEHYLSNKYVQYSICNKPHDRDNEIDKISANQSCQSNQHVVQWAKTLQLPFKYACMYDINKEKRMHHDWMNLPIEKIKHIIKGLLDPNLCKSNKIQFKTTSKQLVESLRYLLLRLGIPTHGYTQSLPGEDRLNDYWDMVKTKDTLYCLYIPKTHLIAKILNIKPDIEYNNDTFTYKNLIFSRIATITQTHYSGTLYDLQMSKTHDYMIHNGVVHNGGGRRNGSFAIYLEPWHPDIMAFLDMKKNHGDEEGRARDLFYALWLNDLFMERVKQNKKWTLMCPDTCRGLADTYGDEFKTLYEEYESKNMGVSTVNARDVWFKILDSQSETGVPYLLYKDACNKKSNQQNLGTIKSSNLCCEIIEYSDDKETAVCNLASIALSKFVKSPKYPFKHTDASNIKIYTKNNCNWCLMMKNELKKNNISYTEEIIGVEDFESFKKQHGVETVPQLYDGDELVGGYTKVAELLNPIFDYDELHKITKIVTANLNKVIDINFYPTKKTEKSNKKNRPVGIGVQGLADTFALMNVPFHSEQASRINEMIFETMYHASLEKSMEISKIEGPYSSFGGSPASKGILQFDMWNVKVSNDRYDWDKLKHEIKEHGIRNSLLLAPMPTASTSQILGNNECFEPFTSNIYVRRTIAGEFIIINKHLLSELINTGLWNEDTKQQMVKENGSIQNIRSIPQVLKDKYKIVWEIPMKHIINMAADRGKFICQSQSMNLWMKNPTYDKLTTMHFYTWSKGLKTGLYYLRTKAKAAPQQFTVEPDKVSTKSDNSEDYEEEDCLMCGS